MSFSKIDAYSTPFRPPIPEQVKGKGTVFVYLLFEHKSYPDPAVKMYLLQSMVRIWTQYRKQGNKGPLPPVLPLVVYHGKAVLYRLGYRKIW